MQKIEELENRLEENGGLDIDHLKYCYRDDFRNHRFNGDFKTWFISFIMNHEDVSRYLANRYYWRNIA